jgi:protein TonB
MRLASFLSHPDPDRAAERRRALSLLITVAIHLLLLLLLLRLAPPFAKMSRSGGSLVSVSVAPEAEEQAARTRSSTKSQRAVSHPSSAPEPTVPPPKIQLPVKAAPWVLTPGLERFDVRLVSPTRSADKPSDASASDEASGNSDSDHPVAYGPGGQPLYDAQWYREPTDGELSFYLKGTRPGPGFGEIACETIARFHVDNCVELAESPGSGLARAVREAAWQFLVMPPRVGGKMMVGAWVRIRIDYTEAKSR